MALFKHVDGEIVEMSPQEEADFEASRIPPPPTTADLLAYAADKRWQVETGGITLMGMPVPTDRQTAAILHAARTMAKENEAYSLRFKMAGGFVPLDAATIIAVADAVHDHVQACFNCEADLAAAIAEDEVTTTAQIDAAFAAL
jgi:hypothetical protein